MTSEKEIELAKRIQKYREDLKLLVRSWLKQTENRETYQDCAEDVLNLLERLGS